MKTQESDIYSSIKIFIYLIFIITFILFIYSFFRFMIVLKQDNTNKFITTSNQQLFISNTTLTKFSLARVNTIVMDNEIKYEEETPSEVVETGNSRTVIFDNYTKEELAEKLDRSLPGILSGKGYIFADYTANTGLDPFLAVSIVLHETGCKWGCSDLVNVCYNVGGIKGQPGCYGGSYQAYNSLDEGIYAFLNNLYYNYYSLGLNTPELINPYYAEDSNWAIAVNNYINETKNV